MKVELCAASYEAIEAAKKYGVDRIELCQNLEFGGTSPSIALVEKALDLGIETHILIRPRIGGFVYSKKEKHWILKEIELFGKLPVQGLVVGAYDEKYQLESSFLKQVNDVKGDKDVTFHRAFDSLSNWQDSLETLVEFGYKRILTSGLNTSVDLGMNKLIEIREFAKDRIEIMTGGGVNGTNIKRLFLDVKPHAIHFSSTSLVQDKDKAIFSAPRLEMDENKIKEWMGEINALRSL